jgi:hypothetical protein
LLCHAGPEKNDQEQGAGDKGSFFCVFERAFGTVSTVFAANIGGLRDKNGGLAPSNLAKVKLCPKINGDQRIFNYKRYSTRQIPDRVSMLNPHTLRAYRKSL